MSLPPSYLAEWPGRFRYPRLCVEVAAGTDDDDVVALLQDVAAGLDDGEALGYLLDQGEFAVAAGFIDDSPWLRNDPAAAQAAGKRLRRRQREAGEEISDAIELLRSRAEAAGVPVPADLPEVGTEAEAFRLPLLNDQIATANRELDEEIEAARSKAEKRTDDRRRALSEVLLTAWRQRISRGQLVTAERLLAVGDGDSLPPDAVPQLRAWDPTVDATVALERMRRRSRGSESSADPQGHLLLETYRGLRSDGTADAAEAFSSALVEFLGETPARRPRPYSGGYLFRLDLSSAASVVPLAWLSDVRVAIQTQDEPLPPATAREERLIVIDAGAGPERTGGRSKLGVLSASDLIRLSTAPEYRGLQLLRLVGRGWTARAVGVADADALGRFLSGPESVAWVRLAWLVDILGLGGAELTRELTNETGVHPAGLHVLLDLVLRSHRDASRGHVGRVWQTVDARSRLVEAVLPSATPSPAARIAFLAALAADGFDAPLQLADLELSIAVEGGNAPTQLLERGLIDLAGHPLVEINDEGVRLLRCNVLTRMREDTPGMLLELLAPDDAMATPAERAWAGHRWALLPERDADQSLDVLLERRHDAILRAVPGDMPDDAIGVIDLLIADLAVAHPGIELDLDLPSQAQTTATPEALRTILAEVVQNALDELAVSGRQRLRIAVHTDGDDVLVDIMDDGNGVRLANPHAVFKPGRSLRAGARGRGLYDAEYLARRIDGRLELVAPVRAGPLGGAHFRLIVPQAEIRSS
jgi:hypothetical protein